MCVLLLCLYGALPAAASPAETVTIQSVIDALRAKGINVLYSSALIQTDDLLELPDITPELFREALAEQGLGLKVLGRDSYLIARLNEPGPGRVEGVVTSESGLPQEGVEVLLKGNSTRTDGDGRFHFEVLEPGEWHLRIQQPGRLGMQVHTVLVESGQTTQFTGILWKPPEIENLVVTSSRYRMLTRNTQQSNVMLAADLAKQAAVANDSFRLINRLPGSASNGLSARPRIRGGHQDEMLILFDGVRLYEPFHLKNIQGLVSAFDPASIDSIELYSGGFQADYGDRLSAVMKIEPIEPPLYSSRRLGFGLYNLSGFFSQNDPGKKYNWMLSARRSNLEFLQSLVETDLGKPVYYDSFMQFNLEPTLSSRLSVNVFLTRDETETRTSDNKEEAVSEDTSGYVWVGYEREHNDALFSRTLISFVELERRREGAVRDPDIVTGRVEDRREFRIAELSQNWQYLASETLLYRFGWSLRYLQGSYDYESEQVLEPPWKTLGSAGNSGERDVAVDLSGAQYSGFTTFRLQVLEGVTLELGIRLDGQDNLSDSGHPQFSPRLNVLYRGNQDWEARLSWGRYYQSRGIHELDVADGIAEFDRAQRSEHLVASYQRQINTELNLRLEMYRKVTTSPAAYFDNLYNHLSLLPELQPDRVLIAADESIAVGIELSLQGEFAETLDWWLSYSYASIEDEFSGQKIRRSWDQENALDLGVNWRVGEWQLGLHFDYHTGWPTTDLFLVETGAEGDDPWLVRSKERNSTQLNDFYSVDFKALREFRLRNSTLKLELGIVNLLNRKNQFSRENGVLELDEVRPSLLLDERSSLSATPVIDLYWSF